MYPVHVFVPGKVHLSGEHAVVYGYPALLSTLNLGVTVEITQCEGVAIKNHHRDGMGIIVNALQITGIKKDVLVSVSSTLPVGSGLGSSAALAAAVIQASYKAQDKQLSESEWFQKTMECERIAHGNPSGGDPATVISKGLIRFVKGKLPERHTAARPVELYLIQSGKPKERTIEMVELVAKRMKEYPDKITPIFEQIGETTEALLKQLESGEDIRELIDHNGRLLESLGTVSERVKVLSHHLRKLGIAVKVSGAGGVRGGSGILLALGDEKAIVEATRHFKLRYWKVRIGERLDEMDTISTVEKA